MAGFLLALGGGSEAPASEWDEIRESYNSALRTHEKRIGEIEAKERGMPDREHRADKITRDRGRVDPRVPEGGRKGQEPGRGGRESDPRSQGAGRPVREQGEYLDVVTNEWGSEGAERKKLRDAMAAVQKNLERINANLTRAPKGRRPA